MTDERAEIARGLAGHLKSQRAAGVRYVPLGRGNSPRPAAPPVQAAPPAPAADEAPPAQAAPPALAAQSAPLGDDSQLPLIETPEDAYTVSPRASAGRKNAPLPPPLPFDPTVEMTLEALASSVAGCLRCKLGAGRTNLVFGVGSPEADLVFVGEAPGADEDDQGIPFVGRAGQMLTRMIENVIGIPREEVYICNILKCRPPGNRNPELDEIDCCEPYLQKQLEVIRPRLIVALGKFAAQWLLQTKLPIGRIRGKFGRYRGIPCLATYHPAYLLRNPREKRSVMDDLLKAKAVYSGELEPGIEILG
ncbi:MAG: uracil-DNA glycosylase [bacterium]